MRLKDANGRLYSEISVVKKQVDVLISESYELRKEIDY